MTLRGFSLFGSFAMAFAGTSDRCFTDELRADFPKIACEGFHLPAPACQSQLFHQLLDNAPRDPQCSNFFQKTTGTSTTLHGDAPSCLDQLQPKQHRESVIDDLALLCRTVGIEGFWTAMTECAQDAALCIEVVDAEMTGSSLLSYNAYGSEADDKPAAAPVVENVDEIKDGMLVYISNYYYEYTKLEYLGSDGRSGGNCKFVNGDKSTKDLWKLVEDEQTKGVFFIENFAAGVKDPTKTMRYTIHYTEPQDGFCYSGGIWPDELWSFQKKEPWGGWMIVNHVYPKCRLATWTETRGGAYCRPGFDQKQMFRLKPAFQTNALWKIVTHVENKTDEPVTQKLSYSEGITESISKSIAYSQTAEISLSSSVSDSVEGIGLTESEKMSFSASFSESYDSAMSGSWSRSLTYKYPIPAHTTICMMQLMVDTHTVDLSDPSFVFSANVIRILENDACDEALAGQ